MNDEQQLPYGWVCRFSDKRKLPYWYHHDTDTRLWDEPTAEEYFNPSLSRARMESEMQRKKQKRSAADDPPSILTSALAAASSANGNPSLSTSASASHATSSTKDFPSAEERWLANDFNVYFMEHDEIVGSIDCDAYEEEEVEKKGKAESSAVVPFAAGTISVKLDVKPAAEPALVTGSQDKEKTIDIGDSDFDGEEALPSKSRKALSDISNLQQIQVL